MQPWMIVILIASIVLVAVVAWFIYDRSQSKRLRKQFGPEYARAVRESGNRRKAESELARREAQARQIRDRQLHPLDREKFLAQWQLCQSQFVDDPPGALERADQLFAELMRARGYSTANPNEQMTNILAGYPRHAHLYREARDIVDRHNRGEVATEELRTAFLHYRTLFDDLLGGYDEEFERAS